MTLNARRGAYSGAVLAVVAGCAMVSGCALASDNSQNEEITAAVTSLTFPAGWVEQGSVQVTCDAVNLDCQEPSARRVVSLGTMAEQACAELVAWIATTPDLVSPTGLRGSEQVSPSAADCVAELSSYSRWPLRANGPTRTGDATWLLLVTPGRDELRLSVVLGSPPAGVWPSP